MTTDQFGNKHDVRGRFAEKGHSAPGAAAALAQPDPWDIETPEADLGGLATDAAETMPPVTDQDVRDVLHDTTAAPVSGGAREPNPEAFLNPMGPVRPAREISRGEWEIEDTVTEAEEQPEGSVFTRHTLHLSGRPDRRARSLATASIYRDLAVPDGEDGVLDKVEQAASKPGGGGKVTMLLAQPSGNVKAVEATMFKTGDGRWAYLPKGSRKKGFLLDSSKVVDIAPGYGHQQAFAETWQRRQAQFVPSTAQVSAYDGYDGIPEDDGISEPPNKIAAVFLIDHPGFGGGRTDGCMFLATDIQKGDGPNGDHIVNGYFWAPGGSGLESEHGSMYTSDLARRGGRVTGYEAGSMTFRDCWTDMPSERTEAYRRVLGHTYTTED